MNKREVLRKKWTYKFKLWILAPKYAKFNNFSVLLQNSGRHTNRKRTRSFPVKRRPFSQSGRFRSGTIFTGKSQKSFKHRFCTIWLRTASMSRICLYKTRSYSCDKCTGQESCLDPGIWQWCFHPTSVRICNETRNWNLVESQISLIQLGMLKYFIFILCLSYKWMVHW